MAMGRAPGTSASQKICLGCGLEKDVEEFNFKCKATGRRQVRCRICTRIQVRRHYDNNREYYATKRRRRMRELKEQQRVLMLAYLVLHPCVDCGESDPVCLEFDHIRGQKVDAVSRMLGKYEWGAVEREMAKCEVRCANCHRKKTATRRGYYRLLAAAGLRP
jgi:hypothetical protein